MIGAVRCRDTQRLFTRRAVPRFAQIATVALRKLEQLDAADELRGLASSPGNRLEALHGSRTGRHSIRINDPWRICSIWDIGQVSAVEIVDYH